MLRSSRAPNRSAIQEREDVEVPSEQWNSSSERYHSGDHNVALRLRALRHVGVRPTPISPLAWQQLDDARVLVLHTCDGRIVWHQRQRFKYL